MIEEFSLNRSPGKANCSTIDKGLINLNEFFTENIFILEEKNYISFKLTNLFKHVMNEVTDISSHVSFHR